MIYLQLFLSFLQIGAFSFGGGYAAMPLIQNQVYCRFWWRRESRSLPMMYYCRRTARGGCTR